MGKSDDYLEEFLKEMDEPLDTEIDFDENLFDEDLLGEDLLGEDLLDEDLLEEDLLSEDLPDEDLTDEDLTDEELSGSEDLVDEDILNSYSDSFETALQEVNEKNALHDKTEESFIEEILGNLDSIVSGDNAETETSDSDFSVEDFSYDDVGVDALSALQEMSEEPAQEVTPEPPVDDTEADVLKILEGLGDLDLELEMEADASAERSEESKANDDALLDFLSGSMMADATESVSDEPIAAEEAEDTAKNATKKDKKNKKSAKKDEKKGFFGKLGTILFGEDEEEQEAEKPKEEAPQVPDSVLEAETSVQEFTDDALDLFKDFTTTSSAAKEEVPEVEDKKKKKKDKKEKVKKEKKPKPKKEKKPKKPKEPDNTPPLPKKPVALILVMVASLVALIIVGTNLLGYSNALKNAENAFVRKNYTEAYSYVSGMEIKEKDISLYEKYQTMALISSEYDAYKNLMAGEFYDLAFDSLIRMVGRCEKFREDAQIYGCEMELNTLEAEAEGILNETFKMTIEEALELYHYRDRRDYSKALNAILKELGMEKVIEE